MRRATAICSFAAIAWAPMAAATPGSADKKPITHDVYDSWRSIQGTQLSEDGVWLVYALMPQDGDGELVARNLKTGAEFRHARGRAPLAVTADGGYVVFTIAPPTAEVDKAKKDKKKPEDQPKSGLGIMTLASGQVATADRVKSFKIPEASSKSVAYLLEPAKGKAEPKKEEATEPEAGKKEEGPKKKEKKKDPGTELVVRDLASGTTSPIADVTDFTWTKDGSWLAYGVSSKTAENDGAFVRGADGAIRKLAIGLGYYKAFAFDAAGRQLAFVSNRDDYQSDPAPFKLYYWTPADSAASPLVTSSTPGMPASYAVSEHGRVAFSKDGSKLFLGTAPMPPAESEDAPEPVKVDIWNWKDPLLQPMQKVRAEEEKKRSYQGVFHVKDRKFVQLASSAMPGVTVTEGTNAGVGQSDVAYRQLVSWDGSYNDVFVVDLRTGVREKLLEKSYFGARMSPGGNYLVWYDDNAKAWFSQRTAAGSKPVNLTGALKVSFQDETWDTPNQPSPYGSPGWTEADRSVLLYDRYDIWDVKPDGTAARILTQGMGREQQLSFRYQRLDPEEIAIPAGKPLLLITTDDRTKASGFYRVAPAGSARPERILMADKLFGGVIKAKKADVIVLTAQRFDEFPNLWAGDSNFAGLTKVSDANPQQAEYRWGTSELIDYVNADGKRLRAILTKPENFDPSKKYPLMVYIYEELGKEAYMFNYNGEKHGLRERDNQKHWTVHMAEYFDHHLLGAPLPEWMEKGVPYLERGKRDLTPFYPVKKITTTETGGKR